MGDLMNNNIRDIYDCQKCELHTNQKPLLDVIDECDVFWLGLSAKKVIDTECDVPLSSNTNSGKIISEIESKCIGTTFYKSNVVKCLPIDKYGKLRYPTTKEMNICLGNFIIEKNYLKPKIVFLLGRKLPSVYLKIYLLSAKG